jgi:hypothetical protein
VNIISASRRTDIPACRGQWFEDAVKKGECSVVQPFTGKKIAVSLKREDVCAFVFWSKNYIPFAGTLSRLNEAGYKFYLNYTVNNYPKILEPLADSPDKITEDLIRLSADYRIYWRYDPVYISKATSPEFHVDNFAHLCGLFSGKVDRVIVNFIQEYLKVIRRIGEGMYDPEYRYIPISDNDKIGLGLELGRIALSYGIRMYSCTRLLYDGAVAGRSHCVDKFLVEDLTGMPVSVKESPAYSGCHCHKSVDIGSYGRCDNSCVYCYASR